MPEEVEKGMGPKELKVAIAGLGVIGGGAALRIAERRAKNAILLGALVSDRSKPRPEVEAGTLLVDQIDDLLALDPSLVIDALPDARSGEQLIAKALERGVCVISANKQAVAGNLATFHKLAGQNNAVFRYGASVGGGVPMVETARLARADGTPIRCRAILNGTVNFILSQIEKGHPFSEAVAAAQSAGFAEPDPTSDLSGEDAKAKLSILSYELFGEELALEGIAAQPLDASVLEKISAKGGVWRQISTIEKHSNGTITALIDIIDAGGDGGFSRILDEGNALEILSENGNEFFVSGKGAGREPTVDNIFCDVRFVEDVLTSVKA